MQLQTAPDSEELRNQVAIVMDCNLTRNSDGQDDRVQDLSAFRTAFVSVTVSGMVFISSLSTGLLATGLPNIAANLGLPDALILWPASIFGLTCGCSLIPIGSVADVIGSGPVYLFGCVFLSLSFLACGLARTGTELIVFRGFQGIAASCCLPTAISILTEIFPQGRQQTRGLAILGASQPLGYSAGLFLGGVLVDSIGWRWGWYIASILSMIVFCIVFQAVPQLRKQMPRDTWRRVACGIDWIGALIASACLGLLSYVLAVTASKRSHIAEVQNIVLLVVAALLIPAFPVWMARQTKLNKKALIPNSVWRSIPFASTCVMLFLVSAVINCGEYFFSLFFQEVQLLSALQASLRFLPNVVIGILICFGTDAVLHKWDAYRYVTTMLLISCVAPLLMALMDPAWSYWYMAFWGMLLLPFAGDVLFIAGALIITDNFSTSDQSLAGSILNTAFQFGSSVGLAVMAVISTSVSNASSHTVEKRTHALLEGYRAAFWTLLGLAVLYCFVGAIGLRGIGKIGLKKE